MIVVSMKEQYGDFCKDIIFVLVLVFIFEKNEFCYKVFCERVCELIGVINGFEYIKVIGGCFVIYENCKLEKEICRVSIIEFDEIWFNGKNIVIFDDVIICGIIWVIYFD